MTSRAFLRASTIGNVKVAKLRSTFRLPGREDSFEIPSFQRE